MSNLILYEAALIDVKIETCSASARRELSWQSVPDLDFNVTLAGSKMLLWQIEDAGAELPLGRARI